VKSRGVSTLSISVLVKATAVSSYLRRLSLRFLPNKFLLHKRENGPGGIRTRICDCDRVLCFPYTTGPERSLWDGAEDGKKVIRNFIARVPNWDEGLR
jgi:hypothetical protein